MKKLCLGALTLTVLAGCATSPMLGPAPMRAPTPATTNKVGAMTLSGDDVEAVIISRVRPLLPKVGIGVPAVLQAPSDVAAQRSLQTLYEKAVAAATPTIDPSLDNALAEEGIAETARELPEMTSAPEVTAYLQGISDRLTKAAGVKPFQVHLLDADIVNAFNAGGNSMVIFSGILPTLKDEASLAAVMAHEMSHGLKRHVIQGMVGQLAAQYAGQQVAAQVPAPKAEMDMAVSYMATLPPEQQYDKDFVLGYLQGKVGTATMTNLKFAVNNLFVKRTLTRNHEAEADNNGVKMLAMAGYDPNAMPDVFDGWNTYPDDDYRYYDHPALGSRVGAIRAVISQYGLAKPGQDRGADRYQAMLAKLQKPATTGQAKVSDTVRQWLCL